MTSDQPIATENDALAAVPISSLQNPFDLLAREPDRPATCWSADPSLGCLDCLLQVSCVLREIPQPSASVACRGGISDVSIHIYSYAAVIVVVSVQCWHCRPASLSRTES